MNEIRQSPEFSVWLASLRDPVARAAISKRIDRAKFNNFGATKAVRDGVWELKFDLGPGYRVYYKQIGKITYILLGGGVKATQDADILKAVAIANNL